MKVTIYRHHKNHTFAKIYTHKRQYTKAEAAEFVRTYNRNHGCVVFSNGCFVRTAATKTFAMYL